MGKYMKAHQLGEMLLQCPDINVNKLEFDNGKVTIIFDGSNGSMTFNSDTFGRLGYEIKGDSFFGYYMKKIFGKN